MSTAGLEVDEAELRQGLTACLNVPRWVDDVVAQARALVEGTLLTRREIAARVGVSHMTITRWARSGGWRTLGWHPRGRRDPDRSWTAPAITPDPWTRLNKAEDLLDALEAQQRVALEDIESALTMLLLARRDHARPQRKRRKAGPANPTGAAS